jgi:NADH-quinone oxidoreductase subunit I
VRTAGRVPRPGTRLLAATAKGLGITLKHFARNFFLPLRNKDARAKAGAPVDEKWKNEIETVQYPEEKVKYPERFRGLHRLMLREDGAVRCVGHVLPHGLSSALHHDHSGRERHGDREAPAVFGTTSCAVSCGSASRLPVRAIRWIPASTPSGDRAARSGADDVARVRSTAIKGGEGPVVPRTTVRRTAR